MNPRAPIFLSATQAALRLLRPQLSAKARLFPTHLPSQDRAQVEACLEVAGRGTGSLTPVWLSDAVFEFRDALRKRFPGARFIRVVQHAGRGGEGYLEVEATQLEADPSGVVRRVLEFLGLDRAAA